LPSLIFVYVLVPRKDVYSISYLPFHPHAGPFSSRLLNRPGKPVKEQALFKIR